MFFTTSILYWGAGMCNVFSLLICFGVLKEAIGCALQLIPHALLSVVHTEKMHKVKQCATRRKCTEN